MNTSHVAYVPDSLIVTGRCGFSAFSLREVGGAYVPSVRLKEEYPLYMSVTLKEGWPLCVLVSVKEAWLLCVAEVKHLTSFILFVSGGAEETGRRSWDELHHVGLPEDVDVRSLFDESGDRLRHGPFSRVIPGNAFIRNTQMCLHYCLCLCRSMLGPSAVCSVVGGRVSGGGPITALRGQSHPLREHRGEDVLALTPKQEKPFYFTVPVNKDKL